MKRFAFTLIAGIMLNRSRNAQIHLMLQEQEVTLTESRSSAWVFPVARDLDEAMDDLKQYCKDRSNVKMKSGGENLIIAEKVSIPTIATKRGDLIGYGYITENYYAVALIFQLGYDISVNSKEWAVEMKNLRNYAKEFMSYHYEQSYARRVKTLEKEIRSLEKERSQNESRIVSLTKKSGNFNKKITKETDQVKIDAFNAEISTLESDIEELQDTLPGLQSQIDLLRNNVDKFRNESYTFQSAIGSI